MDSILIRRLSQTELSRKGRLVPLILVVQRPRTDPPPQHRPPLPRNPRVIVGQDTGPRRGVEEQLVRVGERDVDDGRFVRESAKAGTKGAADGEGVVGGELEEG